MFLAKTLVAIRKAEDLTTVSHFLRNRNERPQLIVACLKLVEDPLAPLNLKPPADLVVCGKYLEGFNFEILTIDYKGDRLSASVYAEAAVKEGCDSILVVSDGRKPLFSPDLAATLASESTVPLIVIKS